MSKRVRADVVSERALLDVLVDQPADRTRSDPRALIVQQDGFSVAFVLGRFGEQSAAHLKITGERFFRLRSERNEAFFAAFASNPNRLVPEVNVIQVHAGDFGYPAASRVQKLEYRAVAFAEHGLSIRSLDEMDYFVYRDYFWESLLESRARHQSRRIHFQHLLAAKKLEKGPQGCQLPRDRSLLSLFLVELRHILANRDVIDLMDVDIGSLSIGARWAKEVIELIEVAQIVSQRMHGGVALILEIVGESIDVFLHTEFLN